MQIALARLERSFADLATSRERLGDGVERALAGAYGLLDRLNESLERRDSSGYEGGDPTDLVTGSL